MIPAWEGLTWGILWIVALQGRSECKDKLLFLYFFNPTAINKGNICSGSKQSSLWNRIFKLNNCYLRAYRHWSTIWTYLHNTILTEEDWIREKMSQIWSLWTSSGIWFVITFHKRIVSRDRDLLNILVDIC